MPSWYKEYRKKLGLTQAEIARSVGISQCQLSRIESGQRHPDPATAKQLAKLLGYEGEPFEFIDAKTRQKVTFRIIASRTVQTSRGPVTILTTNDSVVLEILGRRTHEPRDTTVT